MIRSCLLLCAAVLLSATEPLAAQVTFVQTGNGQYLDTSSDGDMHYEPKSNGWGLGTVTALDRNNKSYLASESNWSTPQPPDSPTVDVLINLPVTLDVSPTVGTLTLGNGGSLSWEDGQTLTIANGVLQNDGLLTISNNPYGSTLAFSAAATISGGGSIQLNNTGGNGPAQITSTATLTQAATHIINGAGNINCSLANNGVVRADQNLGLALGAYPMSNAGTLEAVNGNDLILSQTVLTQTAGGQVLADGGTVTLNGASISGGQLNSGGNGSVFEGGSVTLADLTNNATLTVNEYTLSGTVTNNSTINIEGNPYAGTLEVPQTASLLGTGTVIALQGGYSLLQVDSGGTLTVGPSQVVESNLGGGGNIVFNGTLRADSALQHGYIEIHAGNITVNGACEALDGGYIQLDSGATLTNYNATSQTLTGGTFRAVDLGNGATLDFEGLGVATNNATVTLSGPNSQFDAINGLTANGGTFSLLAQRQFTDSASLTNTGTIDLDAGTTLHVNGTYAGSGSSTLAVTVGGTASSGSQSPGVLQVNGAATLGGTLAVTFTPGATLPGVSDTLAIVSAGSPITGSFGNVASGARLTTTDGQGSFVITYTGANTVLLSDFVVSGASTLPAFFTGQAALGNGVYYLTFPNGNYFGYYSFLSNPAYIYHFDLGYEYVFDAADGKSGVYFYDFASSDFFYTSPGFPFPYLFDFNLNAVLYYYPDPNNPGHYNTNGVRYFYDFATGSIITK